MSVKSHLQACTPQGAAKQSFHLQTPAEPLSTRKTFHAGHRHPADILQLSSKFPAFKYIPDKSYINWRGRGDFVNSSLTLSTLRNSLKVFLRVSPALEVNPKLGDSQTGVRPTVTKERKKPHRSLMNEPLRMKEYLKICVCGS